MIWFAIAAGLVYGGFVIYQVSEVAQTVLYALNKEGYDGVGVVVGISYILFWLVIYSVPVLASIIVYKVL